MDFTLTEDQTMMRDAARKMVAVDIDPIMKAHDQKAPLPKDAMLKIYAALAKLGITAPRLPMEAGGGVKMLDYGLMFEQLPPVVSISLLAHECTVARIYAESTEEQRQRILPDLMSGKKICCTGTTEPVAGSDPRAVETKVTSDAEGLIINGSKMWITNATICDIINVTCRDGASGAEPCGASSSTGMSRRSPPATPNPLDFNRDIWAKYSSTIAGSRLKMHLGKQATRPAF